MQTRKIQVSALDLIKKHIKRTEDTNESKLYFKQTKSNFNCIFINLILTRKLNFQVEVVSFNCFTIYYNNPGCNQGKIFRLMQKLNF